MTSHLLCTLCLALFMTSCTRTTPPSDVSQERRARPYHIVKPGDTTLTVAKQYKMREDDLIRLNKLKSPYKLFKGQRLLVNATAKDEEGAAPPVEPETKPQGIAVKDEDVSSKAIAAPSIAAPMGSGAAYAGGATAEASGSAVSTVAQVGSAAAGLAGATAGGVTATSSAASTPEAPKADAAPAAASNGLSWPVQGKVIQEFGQKLPDGTISDAMNIAAPAGTPIKAAEGGVIKRVTSDVAAYGNLCVIKHPDGSMTLYGHLKDFKVKVGQKVSKGDVIGTVGKTGIAGAKDQPQLFFQVRDAKLKAIDPRTLLQS